MIDSLDTLTSLYANGRPLKELYGVKDGFPTIIWRKRIIEDVSPIFDENSWDTINSVDNPEEYWDIFDTKEYVFSNGERMIAQIAGFNHDVGVDGRPLRISFNHANVMLEPFRVHDRALTTEQSWLDTHRADFYRNVIMNSLPSDLARVIKPARKRFNRHTIVFEDNALLWDLSMDEIGNTSGSAPSNLGALYPIFSDNQSRVRRDIDGVPRGWSQRTVNNNGAGIRTTSNSGANGFSSSFTSGTLTNQHVNIGFCI